MTLGALILATPLAASGCGGRDTVDTPVNWWHQLEGGEIAKDRPPPPGVNDPYPHVGTVPAAAPVVASAALRASVTESLMRQRNLTTRVDANDPLPPPVLPPHPVRPTPANVQAAPTAAPAGGSSATLDAAEATPPAPGAQPNAPQTAATGEKPAAGATTPAEDSEPEIAMPAVTVQADTGPGTVTIPAIPGGPPSSPRLPGLQAEEASAEAHAPVAAVLPDYHVAPQTGTQVAFVGNTDVVQSGETGLVHAVAARRRTGIIVVHGYGEASSSDPEAQADALNLATLRGRAVADMLRTQGVPSRAIQLQADAFGRGASLTLVQ
ncbi:hypothetical protein [Lichenicoccus roseus]|uniref:OmpA-like domain-containing protein n=1 Tax=Lichenicoccus roseus TaxID=2683649 RepID=A0A5R9J3Q0_9PROT|nr:hypothetical protein [Lichenicoccus roseus]TLU71483.1 hypothetical protein FE263_16440 [Lichenicoccus roseus]